MMKFVDVKNDVAFKKIFGNEKKSFIIISFLNAVLKLKGKDQIKEIEIVNPYQFPRVAGEKATVIDVRAIDKKGRQFLVEMQIANVDGFDKRVLYYTCRDYSTQINRGQDYPKLKPTYFVAIMDFNFFKTKDYLSNHIITDKKTHEHRLKDIEFTFIELKKFKKKEDELKTLVDKWIFFIKNAEDLELIPDNVNDAGLMEAYREANVHSWNRNEYIEYDNTFIALQDEVGRLNFAKREGASEKTYTVIKKCLTKNMDIEDIADIVDLPIEEVQQIIQEIQSENNES